MVAMTPDALDESRRERTSLTLLDGRSVHLHQAVRGPHGDLHVITDLDTPGRVTLALPGGDDWWTRTITLDALRADYAPLWASDGTPVWGY